MVLYFFSFQFGHYSCSPKGRSKTSLYWWNAQLCNHNTFYFLDYFFVQWFFYQLEYYSLEDPRLRLELIFLPFIFPATFSSSFLSFLSFLFFFPPLFFLYAHSRCSQVDMTVKTSDRLLLLSVLSLSLSLPLTPAYLKKNPPCFRS